MSDLYTPGRGSNTPHRWWAKGVLKQWRWPASPSCLQRATMWPVKLTRYLEKDPMFSCLFPSKCKASMCWWSHPWLWACGVRGLRPVPRICCDNRAMSHRPVRMCLHGKGTLHSRHTHAAWSDTCHMFINTAETKSYWANTFFFKAQYVTPRCEHVITQTPQPNCQEGRTLYTEKETILNNQQVYNWLVE